MLRLAYLCTAVLQLSLPAAAALADARLEADTLALHPHFEHVRDGCGRVHPENCALCQFIGLQFSGREQASLPLDYTQQFFRNPDDVGLGPASSPLRLPHQRAPPVLL